ncbi:MAG TPA: hypothetical protein DCM02_03110 [Flavobacterium sp.]|nr:hypothetical protein [Flavobacterium sp.]HAT76841.1 hypothetical protein [Flavobacterium sp.]HAT81388.1 hypothetical protein [Flavobacterium sp.]
MIGIENLLNRYKIPYDKNNIIKVFTHNSFSDTNNNSRYVFYGQFAIKGKIADWIFNNIAGTGTQLQHFIGNVTSQKRLETYFDKWKISKVRIAENSKLENQKHIFVYAVLGYIFENATKNQIEKFIFNELIKTADHLLPQNYKHKNRWDQFIFLSKLHLLCKPKLTSTVDENKINHVTIFVNNEAYATHNSISYKYAKKKCVNDAIKKLLIFIEDKLNKDATHIANQENKKQEKELAIIQAKAEKQAKHLERTEKHQDKMTERRRIAKIEAELQDKKRKQAKQAVKEKTSKKGKDTIYRTYTSEEIAAMSASKRRNLQDKGIIPKGI